MNKLKAIKIIVFVLTFLLVAGTLCAISLIVKKSKPKSVNIEKTLSLSQPYGSKIKDISHNKEKTFFIIEDGGLEDRVIVLDANFDIITQIFLSEAENEPNR